MDDGFWAEGVEGTVEGLLALAEGLLALVGIKRSSHLDLISAGVLRGKNLSAIDELELDLDSGSTKFIFCSSISKSIFLGGVRKVAEAAHLFAKAPGETPACQMYLEKQNTQQRNTYKMCLQQTEPGEFFLMHSFGEAAASVDLAFMAFGLFFGAALAFARHCKRGFCAQYDW